MRNFSTIFINKSGNKKPVGVFQSVFSIGSLEIALYHIFFPVFVVLHLEIIENIDQLHENTFFSSSFIEMSLMISSV